MYSDQDSRQWKPEPESVKSAFDSIEVDEAGRIVYSVGVTNFNAFEIEVLVQINPKSRVQSENPLGAPTVLEFPLYRIVKIAPLSSQVVQFCFDGRINSEPWYVYTDLLWPHFRNRGDVVFFGASPGGVLPAGGGRATPSGGGGAVPAPPSGTGGTVKPHGLQPLGPWGRGSPLEPRGRKPRLARPYHRFLRSMESPKGASYRNGHFQANAGAGARQVENRDSLRLPQSNYLGGSYGAIGPFLIDVSMESSTDFVLAVQTPYPRRFRETMPDQSSMEFVIESLTIHPHGWSVAPLDFEIGVPFRLEADNQSHVNLIRLACSCKSTGPVAAQVLVRQRAIGLPTSKFSVLESSYNIIATPSDPSTSMDSTYQERRQHVERQVLKTENGEESPRKGIDTNQ